MAHTNAITQGTFDYAALPTEARVVVKQKTTEIRDRMSKAAQNVVEVMRYDGLPYPCRIAYTDIPNRPVVYWLIDPATWEPFYVGSTVQFLQRMRAHCVVHLTTHPRKLHHYTTQQDHRKAEVTAEHGAVPVAFLKCQNEKVARNLERMLIRRLAGLTNGQTHWQEVAHV